MNKCKNCKKEIEENKSYCSSRCRQKGYRKRQKIKMETKPLEIAPAREYSPEYKDQFLIYQKSKTLAEQIENKIKGINCQIESIENRNNTLFGRKSKIIISYGISVIFSIIAGKVLSAVFEAKRKGLLFIAIFAPALIGAYFVGHKLQKIDDNEYLITLKSLKTIKENKQELEKQLITAKESFEIEQMELEKQPKYVLQNEQLSEGYRTKQVNSPLGGTLSCDSI